VIQVSIRPLHHNDSIPALTEVIHAGYVLLQRHGWNFNGVDQPEAVTAERIRQGICLVAEADSHLIGTILVHGPFRAAPFAYIERDDVAYFQQFAVHPDWQQCGVGSQLLAQAELCAAAAGYAFLSADTAAAATDLVAYYRRRGYGPVGEMQWPGKNYRSVVLSKPLAAAGASTAALAVSTNDLRAQRTT